MNKQEIKQVLFEKIAQRRQALEFQSKLEEAYEVGFQDGMSKVAEELDSERQQRTARVAELMENPPSWGELGPNERKAAIAATLGLTAVEAGAGGTLGAAVGTSMRPENRLKGAVEGGITGAITAPVVSNLLRYLTTRTTSLARGRSFSRALREEVENERAKRRAG